jgi:2-polyprenyl-3-methyl-5-hydroxy-6-metoxy-1,4-benzoquinol methylase
MINQCRFCNSQLKYTLVDLGVSPFANSYLSAQHIHRMESFYPLQVYVCEKCYLVQLPVFQSSEEIFSNYAYFSSFSDSWLQHAETYVNDITERFGLNSRSRVIEIASNDGYLLQYFQKKGIPVLGIEPAQNVARVAQKAGIQTLEKFFSRQTAGELVQEGKYADLLIGNNVLAHVPDVNDFVQGMKIILKPHGIITMEFPHLLRLMAENQFDTIYHEHFSYFSFRIVNKIFNHHGLRIFDVDELPTHGGSLRIYARHAEDDSGEISDNAKALLKYEAAEGFENLEFYLTFNQKVQSTKRAILDFLVEAKNKAKTIVGYGAPAKGNTLLNYCGIRSDFIEYTVDRSPHKQGHFLPGTRIPIHHPDKITDTRPDYVVILPWNLKDEIMNQMSYIKDWNGKFVTLIPEVRIYS